MPPKAPTVKAHIDDHKQHVKDFLALEDHKDPKKVNKPEYRAENDEAKP